MPVLRGGSLRRMSDPDDLDDVPAPDAAPDAAECLPYPVLRGYGFRIERGSAAHVVALELDAARALKANAEARIETAKAQLIHLTGGVERIVLPDGSGYLRRIEDREYRAQPARIIQREVLERVAEFPPPQRR